MPTLDQPFELTQGALVFDSQVSPDTPWRFDTMAEGSSFGNPVPLVEEIRSLLTDGSLSVTTGYENREISFRLRVSAADGQAMAQAEAALMAEVTAERPSPLVYTPTMIEAWPCVFEVVRMEIEVDFSDDWDLNEVLRHQRFYLVKLTCLPWVRDPELTVIEALPVPTTPDAPATTVQIDSCDSAAGWQQAVSRSADWASVTPGPTVAGGAVVVAGNPKATTTWPWLYLVLDRVGSVDMDGFPYLAIAVGPIKNNWSEQGKPADDAVYQVRFQVDGGPLGDVQRPIAIKPYPGNSNARILYFEAPPTFTALRLQRVLYRPPATGQSLRVLDVSRTDRIEIDGTSGFQIARTAIVGGSAPTQAAVSLTAPSPLVGSTALIYTGASPAVPMRRLRTASATVFPDATKISGATNDLSAAMKFLVPVSELTESTYSLLARLSATGDKRIVWQARVVASDGASIPGSEVIVSGETLISNDSADPWRIHALANIQLPVVSIEGSTTHAVEVTLSMASGGADVLIDEAWLLDTRNGAVTVVHEPSTFQLTGIELRSPQIDAPRPAVIGTWQGHGVQDITRLVDAFGTHLFKPGPLHVFTATDLAKYAACELRYYRRSHTYAGPDLPENGTEGA